MDNGRIGDKTLADFITTHKVAGKLGRARGIRTTGRVKVGKKKVATAVQAAKKVGTRGSKPPNHLPTFKEAAATAIASIQNSRPAPKQVIPPHAKPKKSQRPGKGQTKQMMTTVSD